MAPWTKLEGGLGVAGVWGVPTDFTQQENPRYWPSQVKQIVSNNFQFPTKFKYETLKMRNIQIQQKKAVLEKEGMGGANKDESLLIY